MTTNTTTRLVAIAMASAAATIALPATAHASVGFASPSGNIACDVFTRDDGTSSANCDIRDHGYVAPPKRADCGWDGWGDRFAMVQGSAPGLVCHGDPEVVGAALPTLPYGQTRSAGPISCDSEPTGVTCTDGSTGHYFRLSQESYQFG